MSATATLHEAAEFARTHFSGRREDLGVVEGCKVQAFCGAIIVDPRGSHRNGIGAEQAHLNFLAELRDAEPGTVLTDGRGIAWQVQLDGTTKMVTP